MAKYTDDIWHLARIESVDEHNICVQFKKFNVLQAIKWESIFILDTSDDEDDDDDDDNDDDTDDYDDDNFDYDNNFNKIKEDSKCLKSNANTSKYFNSMNDLGDWEKHTKVNFF